MRQRLDKFLSSLGIASRKETAQLAKQGLIQVNQTVVTDRDYKIDPKKDSIMLDGKKIDVTKDVYFMLNKPTNVLSAVSDPEGRSTVVDFIKTARTIFPIGRLDKDTRGLIVLTTDGPLTHRLIHPKFHIPKVYLLTIQGQVPEEQIEKYQKGVTLDGKQTLPTKVSIREKTAERTIMEVTMYEGRFRQIRRTCEILGIKLLDLQRIQFGPISLGNLLEGEYRELTKQEIEELKEWAKGKT